MNALRVTVTIPLVLLLLSAANAQTSDWSALQALPDGTTIKVTLKGRPSFGHCILDEVSDEKLACTAGRWPFTRDLVYARRDIKKVYLPHNAKVIGLLVGMGTGAALGATRSTCCRVANAYFGAAALGFVGGSPER